MGLKGSLSELQLPDLIELMTIGGKTGVVSIAGEGSQGGELGFADGVLVSARCGPMTGDKAFYTILGITRGAFQVDSTRSPGERDIATSAQSLLMEGMRRLDEVRRLRQRLPAAARIKLCGHGEPGDDLEAYVISLAEVGQPSVAGIVRLSCASGRSDEYECLQALERLCGRSILSLASPATP